MEETEIELLENCFKSQFLCHYLNVKMSENSFFFREPQVRLDSKANGIVGVAGV